MKNQLQLQDLSVSSLPELQGWREKQQKLVDENPYIDITDSKSYDVACKSRTALLKGRTELEKQDQMIASKLTSFRKDVKSETDSLIAITLPYEKQQQSEVKRYESIKEAEKAEKERLEQERIAAIKKRIDDFETDAYKIIQEADINCVNVHKSMLDALVNADFDYEEYQILFEQARIRVQSSWDLKCNDIEEKEAQRVQNERLQKEADESKRVSQLQSFRLNELTPYIAYGEHIDLTKLHLVEESLWLDIIASKKALFEVELKNKQEAQYKIESDNQKIYEIRKGRMEREGFVYYNGLFSDKDAICNIQESKVREADVIDFETLLTDAICNREFEMERRYRVEEERIANDVLSKKDSERLKKENKAKTKRLLNDKTVLDYSLVKIQETVISEITFVQFENDETESFRKTVEQKFKLLIEELNIQLKSL